MNWGVGGAAPVGRDALEEPPSRPTSEEVATLSRGHGNHSPSTYTCISGTPEYPFDYKSTPETPLYKGQSFVPHVYSNFIDKNAQKSNKFIA